MLCDPGLIETKLLGTLNQRCLIGEASRIVAERILIDAEDTYPHTLFASQSLNSVATFHAGHRDAVGLLRQNALYSVEYCAPIYLPLW